MNFFPQRPVQNLPDWLEMATRNLVPSALFRIRAEIEAHYAEAVAFHLKNGYPEPAAAQAAALADLGDAFVAARRFRREHMTTDEAYLVALGLGGARNFILFLLGVYIYCRSIFHRLSSGKINGLHWQFFLAEVALFVAFLAVYCIAYIWSARKPAPATRRQIFVMAFINALNFGVFSLVILANDFIAISPGELQFRLQVAVLALAVFIFGSVFLLSLRFLRTLKKLQSAAEDWS